MIYRILLLLVITSCSSKRDKVVENMAFFSGGNVRIGCPDREDCRENEVPVFQTKIDPFYLDISPVTVGEFRKFIQETQYITNADSFGDAGVYNFKLMDWELIKGANWEYPQGQSDPKASDDHPVTQVSWNDACKYCEWKGKRLPTEVEWEFAAKGGKDEQKKYSWGSDLKEGSKFKANVWQGRFPEYNAVSDSFRLTSPVGYYGKTSSGLTDMGGNVWQWCADIYKLYPGSADKIAINPDDKVIRGGSFMCDSNVCHGYRTTARNFCSRETSLMHVGFRCAKSGN